MTYNSKSDTYENVDDNSIHIKKGSLVRFKV